MSKVFINENPQQPAMLRYSGPRGRAVGSQIRQTIAAPPRTHPAKRQLQGFEDPATFIAGLVMLALLGVALVVWWKQVALVAAVFILFGLFARSPIVAVGGALLLLLTTR